MGVAPTIAVPPPDLVVNETDPSWLRVTAKGTPPLSYLWSKDGRPGFIGNQAELVFANPSLEDGGTYTVEVSNRYGTATATCRVTVNPRPIRGAGL